MWICSRCEVCNEDNKTSCIVCGKDVKINSETNKPKSEHIVTERERDILVDSHDSKSDSVEKNLKNVVRILVAVIILLLILIVVF